MSVTQFKRGSKSAVIQEATTAVGNDEEKEITAKEEATVSGIDGVEEDEKKKEAALREAPKMTNTFSWQHINYVIPAGRGKTRKLLDDVSGFVSPGKLTALMGESGAGKVRFVLCQLYLGRNFEDDF